MADKKTDDKAADFTPAVPPPPPPPGATPPGPDPRLAPERVSRAVQEAEEDADEAEPTRHDETVPGGRYIRGTTIKKGKHYGGVVQNAHGRVLATFTDKQVNTGDPADGKKVEYDPAEVEAAEGA